MAFEFRDAYVRSRPAKTSFLCLFYGFSDLVDGLLGYVLNLADRLVGFALRAKVVVARQRTSSFLESAFHYVCLSAHDGASCCYEFSEKTKRKKTDVQKHPEAFMHVGLRVNGPPIRLGYPSSNHPTRRPDRFRHAPLTSNHRTPRRKGNANRAMAASDRVSWKAWK